MRCITYLQGPSPGFKAAAVNPDDGGRRQRSGRLPMYRWQCQRFPHPHRDLECATGRGRPRGFPLRGRFKTMLAGEHGLHRPRRRSLCYRATAHASGDQEFRKWIQTHTPDWECVWDRPDPRHTDGPRDRWYVYRAPLLSAEVLPIVWVWSTLLTLHQQARRRRDIAAATEELNAMRQRLAGAKARLRGAADIDFQIKTLLDKHHVNRYLKVSRVVREEHVYKQTRRGRPGPDTAYRKITKRRFDIEWATDEEAIAYDHNSDGIYPLITNDRSLSPAQVLEAYKANP